jgi:sporulation integral membrane protein YlbJ
VNTSNKNPGYFKARFTACIMAFGAIFLTISMVLYPDISFEAAAHGLKVWFEIVFPALLPFFIGSEILMGLGAVHFLGVLLEPFMRPVFNVPGVGAFVMAMGLASGYPIGAVLTGKLRRQKMVSRVEAERLLSFTNTADPLFMFGAVAIGMFGIAKVGSIIAFSHYISALLVGIILRFYGRSAPAQDEKQPHGNILFRACQALYRARLADGRPFGQLMGDAIRQSINTMLLVGGFIILFSVVIRVATMMGLTAVLSLFFARILSLIGLETTLAEACISGLFEITIGSDLASSAPSTLGSGLASLSQRIAVTSGIIAWSGISVHCQVAAIINDTDIRLTPYLTARILHAILATSIALIMVQFNPVFLDSIAVPVYLQTPPDPAWSYWGPRLHFLLTRVGTLLLILVLSSAIYSFIRRLRLIPLLIKKQ